MPQDDYAVGDLIEHRLVKIERTDNGFVALEHSFPSLAEAKSFVDKKVYRGR